jgi:uncharacterized protein YcbK (DUF882 family)
MKYFNYDEFKCRCCEQLPDDARRNIDSLVSEVLDPARERLGAPVYVNSGYRCPKHNTKVGGVKNSQHMKGEAADITTGTVEGNMKLKAVIEELGKFDQLITYPTFLHVSWKRNGGNRKQRLRKISGGYAKA